MLTIAQSLLKRDKGHRFGLIEIGRKGDGQTQLVGVLRGEYLDVRRDRDSYDQSRFEFDR